MLCTMFCRYLIAARLTHRLLDTCTNEGEIIEKSNERRELYDHALDNYLSTFIDLVKFALLSD